MNQMDFDRLNFLSEKTISDKITPNELNEFKLLIKTWNTSFELNLVNSLYSYDLAVEKITSLKVGDTFK